jgi:hypothetical protein
VLLDAYRKVFKHHLERGGLAAASTRSQRERVACLEARDAFRLHCKEHGCRENGLDVFAEDIQARGTELKEGSRQHRYLCAVGVASVRIYGKMHTMRREDAALPQRH